MKHKLMGLTLLVLAAAAVFFLRPQAAIVPDSSFIFFDGQYYYEDLDNADILTRGALDGKLGEVRYTVGPVGGKEFYVPRDGDASLLSKGTPIYALKNYSPGHRLAAVVRGKVRIFQRGRLPVDMLALRTTSIEILNADPAKPGHYYVAAEIHEAALDQVLEIILAGEEDISRFIHKYSFSSYMPAEPRIYYHLRFILQDGTRVTMSYDPDDNCLGDGLYLEGTLISFIQEALDRN